MVRRWQTWEVIIIISFYFLINRVVCAAIFFLGHLERSKSLARPCIVIRTPDSYFHISEISLFSLFFSPSSRCQGTFTAVVWPFQPLGKLSRRIQHKDAQNSQSSNGLFWYENRDALITSYSFLSGYISCQRYHHVPVSFSFSCCLVLLLLSCPSVCFPAVFLSAAGYVRPHRFHSFLFCCYTVSLPFFCTCYRFVCVLQNTTENYRAKRW